MKMVMGNWVIFVENHLGENLIGQTGQIIKIYQNSMVGVRLCSGRFVMALQTELMVLGKTDD